MFRYILKICRMVQNYFFDNCVTSVGINGKMVKCGFAGGIPATFVRTWRALASALLTAMQTAQMSNLLPHYLTLVQQGLPPVLKSVSKWLKIHLTAIFRCDSKLACEGIPTDTSTSAPGVPNLGPKSLFCECFNPYNGSKNEFRWLHHIYFDWWKCNEKDNVKNF